VEERGKLLDSSNSST